MPLPTIEDFTVAETPVEDVHGLSACKNFGGLSLDDAYAKLCTCPECAPVWLLRARRLRPRSASPSRRSRRSPLTIQRVARGSSPAAADLARLVTTGRHAAKLERLVVGMVVDGECAWSQGWATDVDTRCFASTIQPAHSRG
jgi:hypothetical protein